MRVIDWNRREKERGSGEGRERGVVEKRGEVVE